MSSPQGLVYVPCLHPKALCTYQSNFLKVHGMSVNEFRPSADVQQQSPFNAASLIKDHATLPSHLYTLPRLSISSLSACQFSVVLYNLKIPLECGGGFGSGSCQSIPPLFAATPPPPPTPASSLLCLTSFTDCNVTFQLNVYICQDDWALYPPKMPIK
jgi:hypothetical protein